MRYCWLSLAIFGVILGCGQAGVLNSPVHKQVADNSPSVAAERLIEASPLPALTSAPQPEKAANSIHRKIVYRATVDLVVEDFEPIPAKIEALVKRFDAYLARSNVTGTPGSPRSGQWTVRVPADRYDAFLAAARKLGEVRRVGSDSQDVTEEFYDVEARIRNKKQEEARLLKLLDTATAKLADVLAVEQEVSRVRGEIEQSEGRMRVLSDLTALATVDLVVTEIKNYVPEEAVTYATRLHRSFDASIRALIFTGDQLSIALVALSPWLAIVLIPGVPLAFWVRARIRRRREVTVEKK
jgi:hypothetical protein